MHNSHRYYHKTVSFINKRITISKWKDKIQKQPGHWYFTIHLVRSRSSKNKKMASLQAAAGEGIPHKSTPRFV